MGMKLKTILWLVPTVAVTVFALLLVGCGGGSASGPSLPQVAVLTNEAATDYAGDVVDKLEATGQFSRVDTINAASATPTLGQLQSYDGVLTYTGDNGPAILDTTALGDVLADFVDGGGGLVVAFAAVVNKPGLPEFALGGRYVSGQYYLIPRVDSTIGSQSSGAILDSTHPILDGFLTLDGGTNNAWADTTQVMPGATVVLQWADGKPLVAVTTNAYGVRRVDLNFYPPSSEVPDSRFWVATTDGDLLMANSLTWVAHLP